MNDIFDNSFLVMVSTAHHMYAVRRDHILELRVIAGPDDCERPDRRGKPVRGYALGPLLDPAEEREEYGRCHALVVAPNRRRSVALLVARVEHFAAGTEESVHALPELLHQRLARPWFLGVLLDHTDDEPVLVLDIRQIAKDLLIEKTRSHTHATDHEQPRHSVSC